MVGVQRLLRRVEGVGFRCRRWRSNPSGKREQVRLPWGIVTSTMGRTANPSGCARCGAGAGCPTVKHNLSRVQGSGFKVYSVWFKVYDVCCMLQG